MLTALHWSTTDYVDIHNIHEHIKKDMAVMYVCLYVCVSVQRWMAISSQIGLKIIDFFMHF